MSYYSIADYGAYKDLNMAIKDMVAIKQRIKRQWPKTKSFKTYIIKAKISGYYMSGKPKNSKDIAVIVNPNGTVLVKKISYKRTRRTLTLTSKKWMNK